MTDPIRVLKEVAAHVHPALGTDGSHDAVHAAASHTAELDREAIEGMVALPPAGPSASNRQADAELLASIEEGRAANAAPPAPFQVHDPLEDLVATTDRVAGELLDRHLQVVVPVVDDPEADLRRHGIAPTPRTWDHAKPEIGGMFAGDIAYATCPNGHTCRLVSKVHHVKPSGDLWPSYVCPADGCTFHDFVHLEGWEPR